MFEGNNYPQFVYCESTEGGMDTYYFTRVEDIPRVYGWMSTDVLDEDEALVDFVRTADIGDVFEHRLGVCVRLKDTL